MFYKQEIKAIIILIGLVIACSSQTPQLTSASITPCIYFCIKGTKCVNGKCVPDTSDQCIFPQIKSPAGCIESCKSPRFKDCPTIFPLYYFPRFCGYNQKENQWINYTFDCQACQNINIIGIIHQKCNCTLAGCNSNQICNIQTGLCQAIQYPKCSPNPPNKAECLTKPTKQECPDIVYIRPPDLVYCGIDEKGNKKGFARGCQVCLTDNFAYYYKAPCDQVPQIFCKDYQTCTAEGNCIDKCATIKCKQGYICKMGQCIPIDQCFGKCKDYQRCFNGQCLDNCKFLKCANCFKGICGYEPGKNECKTDIDCRYGQICRNGKCVDKCKIIKCSPNQKCTFGFCFPV